MKHTVIGYDVLHLIADAKYEELFYMHDLKTNCGSI